MSSWRSACPQCHNEIPLLGSDSRISTLFAWSTPVVCGLCEHTWVVCCGTLCVIPYYKNVFYTRRQLRDHARYWHCKNAPTVSTPPDVAIDPGIESCPDFSTDPFCDSDTESRPENKDQHSVHETIAENTNSNRFSFSNHTTTQFTNRCINGSIQQAIVCLVQQSLLQEEVSVDLESTQKLSTDAVRLFLYIAKLLVSTGLREHHALSSILELLLGLIPPEMKSWPTMPSTIAGFQSNILNPTNKNSLVSLLPMPATAMLPDESHAYTCLQEIVAFVLVVQNPDGPANVPLRLQLLCKSFNFHQRPSPASCLVSIGLLFWMDGWDPSTSSKNNRSPVHTATVTLLCIDNGTGIPFDARTFPIACGPGKADHNAIFHALQTSLATVQDDQTVMWSHYHRQWTTLQCHIIALLMDNPERRGSNCLLGGNAKQHGMFGLSCNFEQLERPFSACPDCLRVASIYLDAGCFTKPVVYACSQCYAFSLSELVKHGKYKKMLHDDVLTEAPLSSSTPGYSLSMRPQLLNFELLVDGWNHAIRKLVHDQTWTKKQVEIYFNLLCINQATVDHFMICCGNYMLLETMAVTPDNFADDFVEDVEAQRSEHPGLFHLPVHPAAWGIGSLNQRVETIMHLAMNTQKAVFKLMLQWCANLDHGQTLRTRLQPLVDSVQALRLPFLPVRMFKNEKFGGFVAENYRALTHLAPWLFRCFLEDKFAPTILVLPPENKPRTQWTMKENKGWLRSRGIKIPTKIKAAELTELVETYHATPEGPPPLKPMSIPPAADMRKLIILMYKVFGTLFAIDLPGQLAGNRFEVIVVEFLNLLEAIGRACHPDKKKPIWVSKYGILGLLRCRQHFIDYQYIHSLYEGGIEGEGMVKELRPLCPNAVKSRWALNLMNAYNRQNILNKFAASLPVSESPMPSVKPHDPNCKRYSSWADVVHAREQKQPISLIILGGVDDCTCYVMVHMYHKSYTRRLFILPAAPFVDEHGFAYHSIGLDSNECLHDINTPGFSFGILLPDIWNESGPTQYAIVDKEWRYVNEQQCWTHL